MLKSRALFATASVLLLAGCGGGSSMEGTPAGGGSTIAAGSFTISGQSREPQIASGGSSGVSVYAVNGNLTAATLRDQNPTLAETEIVHLRTVPIGGYGLYACAQDGTDARLICTIGYNMPASVKIHPSGAYVYFNLTNTLFRCPLVGGSPAVVMSDVASFGFTPSGNKMIIRRAASQNVATANPDGSGVVTLGSYAQNLTAVNGMSETVALMTGGGATYRLPLSPGSTPTNIVVFSANPIVASYLPGHRTAFISSPNGSNYDCFRLTATDAVPATSADNLVSNQIAPVGIAPDDSQLCFCDAAGRLQLYSANVSSFGQVADLLPHSSPSAWTPYVLTRTFIGAGTSFTTGAAALLFSENETKVPTVVIADCTTRTSMVVTRVSQDNTTNVVFRLDCDNLKSLSYTKSNGFVPTAVVSAATGLKGAFVSFSATTGKVSTVVTFTKRPTFNRTGNGYEISGEGIATVNGETRSPASVRL